MALKSPKNCDRPDALADAVAEWREAPCPAERLSGATRTRILADARHEFTSRPERTLADLFLPARRFAVAAGLPLLAATLLLGYVLLPGPAAVDGVDGVAQLEAKKVGGEVVFVIANGGTAHRVRKSLHPNELTVASTTVTVRGSFRDRLDGEPGVVFYKVD